MTVNTKELMDRYIEILAYIYDGKYADAAAILKRYGMTDFLTSEGKLVHNAGDRLNIHLQALHNRYLSEKK